MLIKLVAGCHCFNKVNRQCTDQLPRRKLPRGRSELTENLLWSARLVLKGKVNWCDFSSVNGLAGRWWSHFLVSPEANAIPKGCWEPRLYQMSVIWAILPFFRLRHFVGDDWLQQFLEWMLKQGWMSSKPRWAWCALFICVNKHLIKKKKKPVGFLPFLYKSWISLNGQGGEGSLILARGLGEEMPL